MDEKDNQKLCVFVNFLDFTSSFITKHIQIDYIIG